MKNFLKLLSSALALLAAQATPAAAQSDPAGFAAVINIPADQPSISGGIDSDTQLNLAEGGTIVSSLSDPFSAGSFSSSGSDSENVSRVTFISGLNAET